MISQRKPLLPLLTWFELMGFNPLYSFQLASADLIPYPPGCNPVVFQHAYQNADAAGRDQITEAIRTAEGMLQKELRFAVGPQFECDEMSFPHFFDRTQHFTASIDTEGRWEGFQLANGWLRNIGTQKLTLIEPAAQITRKDFDGDGVLEGWEIASVPKPAGMTDPAQILAFFTDADRYDDTAEADRWQIEPITVIVNDDDTLTIRGSVANIVKPVLYQGFTARTPYLDVASAGTFVEWLELYMQTVDTTQMGEFVWETRPMGCGECPQQIMWPAFYADPAAYATLPFRATIRDAERGWIAGSTAHQVAGGDGWAWRMWQGLGYQPSIVRVNYLAGYPTEGRNLNQSMRLTVARLAAAELNSPICACKAAHRELFRWQEDLAQQSERSFRVSQEDLNNPFGTRRGHVDAWKQIQRYIRQVGIHSG